MPSNFVGILNMTRSAILARFLDLDVRSHNLTNLNTAGFKSTRSNFQEALEAQQFNGVQTRSTSRMMDQGALTKTDDPLSIAINGEGFFAVMLPDDRIGYTRDGQFHLDADRQLVNNSGFPLDWEGEIPEGASNVHVNPDGSVVALVGDTWTSAGNIQLTRFAHPSGLESYGQNIYLPTEVSGEGQAGEPNSEGYGQMVGGALEASNVNMAEEMTGMIALERSYQMSVRVFQSTDQMMSQAIHLRR